MFINPLKVIYFPLYYLFSPRMEFQNSIITRQNSLIFYNKFSAKLKLLYNHHVYLHNNQNKKLFLLKKKKITTKYDRNLGYFKSEVLQQWCSVTCQHVWNVIEGGIVKESRDEVEGCVRPHCVLVQWDVCPSRGWT